MLAQRQSNANAARSALNDEAGDTLAESDDRLRILVVEDNKDAQKMVCELLMMLGHRVQGVSDAEAALEALAAARFDVLFTDVNLPGMSGVELARKAASEMPGLKIIFSSGYGAIASHDFGFRAASLPKPYSLEKLQQVLADVAPI
jgi:CheY-like chemotaxis protein